MRAFTHIANVQLLDPARFGVQLAWDDDLWATSPIVMSPTDFLADFSTLLTALRAMAETRPVNRQALRRSWQQQREALRRRLVEEDPWAMKAEVPEVSSPDAADSWARLLCEPAPEPVGEPVEAHY